MATVVYITSRGREIITNRLGANTNTNGGTGPYSEPKVVGWGTANSSISQTLPGSNQPSDIAPFQEAAESRNTSATSSVVTTTTTSDTYQVAGTITSGSVQTIGESFLTPSGTKPAASTLNGSITSGSSSITVQTPGTAFPSSGTFYVQVENEVIQIASISGNVLTVAGSGRGQLGTTAASHASGVGITLGNIPGTAAAANNGDMFLHACYTGLSLNSGDSLAATLQVKFT